jgi:predicted deacylase
MPIRVLRGPEPGPVIAVTAAVHGDEINGTGVIHELMYSRRPDLKRGTLILVPVVDLFGFETQSRYMPDRRDLNRCFPGSRTGSLSRRVAYTFFTQVIRRCDYVLDLHSAASGRTNFPNVRADLENAGCRKLARAFGCELIVSSQGPEGSLRRVAVKAGVPTIILEAGEPSKIEPSVLEIGARGVLNVLAELKMTDGKPRRPPYQTRVKKTTWVRAATGGLLRFHVSPGQIILEGQPISTNFSVFGEQQNVLKAPHDGIILSMTTLPAVKPGEPVCNVAVPGRDISEIRKKLEDMSRRSIDHQIRRDLATSVMIHDHDAEIASQEQDDLTDPELLE